VFRLYGTPSLIFTGLAQLVEHWSPKPGVGSSSLSTRANTNIIMAGIVNYIKESFEELKNNVSWPTWAETQSLTILVAVFSIIFSLAIWGVDTVFSKVIGYYFNVING
jgi:preprotein translocase subunit SecE